MRWLTGVDAPPEGQLVEAWEQSVAAFERYPHAFERARSQARLAAVLRSTGRTAEADVVAVTARATARLLDAKPLLAELGTPLAGGRDDAPGHAALTPREREVLLLVAEGRSNSEIGQLLYISGKTAIVHVSNILSKLGARGRTEAVAIARRHGLLPD